MQKTDDKKPYNDDLLAFDTFLLTQESSKQAFINLSKTKDEIRKDELIEETKRVLREAIMQQIKANQVRLKRQSNIKSREEKISSN